MAARFYVASPIAGRTLCLTGSEAHHLAHVLRAQAGDPVVLFDGSGAEFPARVTRVERTSVQLEILGRRDADRELPWQLTLGVALPKGERQRWLIEKAVELGVARVVPLLTVRGVAQPVDRVLERLRRAVAEASKQCGRNRLLEIAAPQRLAEFLRAAPVEGLRLLADPDPGARPLASLAGPCGARQVSVAIGPEGGFVEHEREAAGEWQRVRLGPRILRVETAAIAAAAWFALVADAVAESASG